MKIARTLLVLPGLAALAWGVVLFAEYALPLRPDVFGTVGWIVGGPLVNDGVVAPLTAILGIVLARVLPRPWRVPVVTGTVITGVLLIVAFPLLWRPYGTPPMPGLHDGNPALGLALTLAAVWLLVLLPPLARRIVRPGTRVVRPDERTDPSGAAAASPGTPADSPGTSAEGRPAPPGASGEPANTHSTPPSASAEPPNTHPAPPGKPADPPRERPAPPGTPTTPPGP